MHLVGGQAFADRRDAGRALGERLATYAVPGDVVVLGLPRGGVPVAAQVATRLDCPLDVLIVRKIGAPGQRELALGAVATAAGVQVTVRNHDLLADLRATGLPDGVFERVERRELEELARREDAYREGRAPVSLTGRAVILVDDGLATGASMRAAVTVVKRLGPSAVVVAVPVGSDQACDDLRPMVDALVCLRRPHPFRAVGYAYRDFSETSDDEVSAILHSPPQ
ncbi:phosphoribosyltransferase [Segeticoccus rhizosphaerae]|uniref:phosphoribosyltransferase n=1 Tax=Segeticoccus rhizosphaerae TaxID=1104777 RepID=UPI0010C0794E|nr:phosphoribosyltransferase family protein [Ornithinicoccus soli]